MSYSLRNRRMSEFANPKNVTLTSTTFNLDELAAQLPQSTQSQLQSQLGGSSQVHQTSSKPGVKRQQTYVRTTDAVREKEKKKGESKKSKVGEKIKKRLSMR
jgi:hypothetical protein